MCHTLILYQVSVRVILDCDIRCQFVSYTTWIHDISFGFIHFCDTICPFVSHVIVIYVICQFVLDFRCQFVSCYCDNVHNVSVCNVCWSGGGC